MDNSFFNTRRTKGTHNVSGALSFYYCALSFYYCALSFYYCALSFYYCALSFYYCARNVSVLQTFCKDHMITSPNIYNMSIWYDISTLIVSLKMIRIHISAHPLDRHLENCLNITMLPS